MCPTVDGGAFYAGHSTPNPDLCCCRCGDPHRVDLVHQAAGDRRRNGGNVMPRNPGKTAGTVVMVALGVVLAGFVMNQLRDVDFIAKAHAGFDS